MTAESLSAISGVVLSLAFSYIPELKRWFDTLNREYKQMLMGVLLLVVSSAIFGLSCAKVVDFVTCDRAGLLGLVNTFISALVANQSVYLITRREEHG